MKKIIQKYLSLLIVFHLVTVMIPISHANEASLRVMDTTAGSPALIMLTGEPGEVVNITIENPFQSTITKPFQLDDEGGIRYWYRQAVVAGKYKVSYAGNEETFSVYPGLPDPKLSQLDLNDYTAYIGKTIQGSLRLKDSYGNLISGRDISIEKNGASKVDCLRNCKTDQDGMLQFRISSQSPGLKKISILDKQTNLEIFQEDLGFIPKVRTPIEYPAGFYRGYGAGYGSKYGGEIYGPTYNDNLNTKGINQDISGYYQAGYIPDYIPLRDQTRATFDSQGNSDSAASNAKLPISTFMGADLFGTSSLLAQVNDVTSSTLAQNTNKVDHFEIILSSDPKAEYKETVTVAAQTALDIVIRAVNSLGDPVETYTGEIKFELSNGGLVPNDYKFSEIDKGKALFELAMVLSKGDFTLTVTDKDKPALTGEVSIISKFQAIQNINNTNVQLTIDSPVENSTYAKEVSVQGFTNTENTEIVIKEGPIELKRGSVDENKRFSFVLSLADGNHSLDITAIYLPDGSETKTSVSFEIDKTPPVITQVIVPSEPIRAGESFSISAIAEKRSNLQVFINNRSYDLISKGGENYELIANAPLDPGKYPVLARATDEIGNVTESPDVGVLNVVPGLKEINNLFGIPGIGTITLSWTPVEEADRYEVSYRSILGKSEQVLTTQEPGITIKDLAEKLSYVFTVVAKDVVGNEVSKSTQSKAIKVLEAPMEGLVNKTEVSVMPETNVKQAAPEIQKKPKRYTKSGPEVYLLILLSFLVLNGYGRVRKAMASRE